MSKKVAILATNGFEQIELTSPKSALEDAGIAVEIVSPASDSIRGWKHTEWGDEFPVDRPLNSAKASEYDALMLPGGVMNPDSLRRNRDVINFVRDFFLDGKPVAAICHAAWTLIDAGVVDGRRMTSYHTIQTDLKNAGANWVDEEVVVDSGLVTSRSPDDLPAFNRKLVEEVGEGIHEGQTA
jgi:protease I